MCVRNNKMSVAIRGMGSVLIAVAILLLTAAAGPARGQSGSGNHLWNFRQNADDRFHSNEAWVRPWRYNYEDGWGRWVGNYGYHIPWGSVSTIGNSDGSFTITRSRDHQFHAWTYVYVATARTITYHGAGDCVPRIFLNYAFDVPMQFPAVLNLLSGWNRIDITGYNQNNSYTFSCGPLATLVEIMNTSEFSLNDPPVADPGGDYMVDEGSPVPFDGSGSSDPDGDPLQYRWDFDGDGTWDTPWSPDPLAVHAWGDDWSGAARLEVSDGSLTNVNEASVTVRNVAPAAVITGVDRPDPGDILPNQVLTFHGTFADPGWLDTHTCTWDFGDGTTAAGTVEEENDPPDATGTCRGTHAYASPGSYWVTLTVRDDNAGEVVAQRFNVVVAGPTDLVQTLRKYILNLPDSAFDRQPDNRRRWFDRQLEDAAQAIAAGDLSEAISDLELVRSRADGSVGGKPKDDWIVDTAAQQEVCAMIDEIIAGLQ